MLIMMLTSLYQHIHYRNLIQCDVALNPLAITLVCPNHDNPCRSLC